MKRIALGMILIAGSLFAIQAYAEGCEGQQRPLTAKEKAFYSGNFKVLRAALPRPPAGWQYTDADKDKLDPGFTDVPDNLCTDYINYYIGLDMGYERPVSDADQAKLDAAMQAKPDPAKQKELEGLMAQQQALIQKTVAAAQKQDSKAMDALSKQGDALNAKISKVEQEMNAGQSAAMEALQHDREAKVHISINDASGGVTCYGSPKPLQIAGAIAYQCQNPATYSSPGEVLDHAVGRIVVVYGKGAQVQTEQWSRQDGDGKEHQDSYVDIKYPLDESHPLAVQDLVINIEGDDLDRALSLYKQMNLAPLAALVKK